MFMCVKKYRINVIHLILIQLSIAMGIQPEIFHGNLTSSSGFAYLIFHYFFNMEKTI